jgi:hypothetical protein
MRLPSVALTTALIMAGLIGCASSHTKPKHDYAYHKHAYGSEAHRHEYPHESGHRRERSHWSGHGHHYRERHGHPRTYRKPAPIPGRTPDGRYVLPGGLESVCAGGVPPPCQ